MRRQQLGDCAEKSVYVITVVVICGMDCCWLCCRSVCRSCGESLNLESGDEGGE